MVGRNKDGSKRNEEYITGHYPPLMKDSFWKRIWARASRRFGKKQAREGTE